MELEEWFGCEFVGKLLQREGICFKLRRKVLSAERPYNVS